MGLTGRRAGVLCEGITGERAATDRGQRGSGPWSSGTELFVGAQSDWGRKSSKAKMLRKSEAYNCAFVANAQWENS